MYYTTSQTFISLIQRKKNQSRHLFKSAMQCKNFFEKKSFFDPNKIFSNQRNFVWIKETFF